MTSIVGIPVQGEALWTSDVQASPNHDSLCFVSRGAATDYHFGRVSKGDTAEITTIPLYAQRQKAPLILVLPFLYRSIKAFH